VNDRIIALIARVAECEPSEVTLEARLADDLKLDSMMMVLLVISVEEAFGVAIDEAQITALQTVRNVVDTIQRRTTHAAAH
jgi:acyl carrier protein